MVVRRGGTEWGRGGGGGEAWREERRIRGEGGIVTGARRRAESISGKRGCHFNLLYKIQFGIFEKLKI
jgi:hypothetical protein